MREQLLGLIESGRYGPGDLLPSERILCETLGVSRVSVREAIAGLEAMGLIVVRHGKGASVNGTLQQQVASQFQRYLGAHKDEILHLFNVRGALDQLAAEEAANGASSDGLRAIEQAHQEFRTCAEATPVDFARLARLDVNFHLSIARASENQLLLSLLEDLHGAMEDLRRMTVARSRRQPQRSVGQHGAILEAILAGDAPRSSRAVRRHLAGIRSWITEVADEVGNAETPTPR